MIKPLYDYPTESEMDEETMKVLMALYMAEMQGDELPHELLETPEFRILESRNPSKATYTVIAFCTCLCKTPAELVMWAYTLHRMGDDASLATLVHKFPLGFPTPESYRQLWEDQKQEGCNALDKQETWK